MRLLLDTHIALWSVFESARLPRGARALLDDPDTRPFVSVVSLWEIGIKHAIIRRNGDRAIAQSASVALRRFEAAGLRMLAIEPRHALPLDGMPLLHGDPFDRLLVAQATAEPMRLLTQDSELAAYGESVLAV